MAVLLHVTPAMPRKFGEIGLEVISTGVLSLPPIYVVIYWQNYVQSLRRAKHV